MSIRFACTRCAKKLKAHIDQAGSTVQCTGCGETLQVPATEPSAPAAADEEEAPLIKLRKGSTEDEIDMTPMIDMTFLLLIFFMVTATFALQSSIQIPPPKTEEEGATQSQTVEEDPDGQITVRIDQDSELWIEDHRVTTRQELISQLRDARNGIGGPPCSRLLVECHADAKHEKVVMALDVGAEVGMGQVALKTTDEEL